MRLVVLVDGAFGVADVLVTGDAAQCVLIYITVHQLPGVHRETEPGDPPNYRVILLTVHHDSRTLKLATKHRNVS